MITDKLEIEKLLSRLTFVPPAWYWSFTYLVLEC